MTAPRAQRAPGVVRGEHQTRLDDGRVRCDLCPRACTMAEGQRAFCFVRGVEGGEVVLSSYGLSTGFCIDPIEKKPLNHFYPGSSVLSFGTAGCNLGCRFCQNWDISKARQVERLSSSASPLDIARAAKASGCTSVAFTYNDPVIFHEYAVDTARACHEEGVKAVAVTAGYITARARADFFAPMDAANVDLKAFTERFYEKLCFAQLGPVLETLEFIRRETQVWLEVTTLLIPGHNDSPAEVTALSEWMVEHLGPDVPLHLSAFHPDYKLVSAAPTSAESLREARRRAREAGLRHVYTGNIIDPDGQATRCHHCDELLIARDRYAITRFTLRAGACPSCGTTLPGHFADAAGDFGNRRLPIALGGALQQQAP